MANLGSIQHAGGDVAVIEGSGPQVNGRWLLIAAAACFTAALGLAGAHLYAFELVVAAAAVFLSTDGLVEPANRRALSTALLAATALAALAGALLLALSVPVWRALIDAIATWDPLRRLGLDVPNPHLVLGLSAALGALFIAAYAVSRRLGGPLGRMFEKEGPLELATVVLELAAVFWCITAAVRWNRHRERLRRAVPALYAALAVVLFLVAMEELNWGQTLLAFETPAAWAAINYQQETSLHNLLDMQTLGAVTRVLAVLFGLGVLALIGLALARPRSVFAAIAPPASLAVLALLSAFAGAYLHAEVFELLLAFFFAFYSYRVYLAARS